MSKKEFNEIKSLINEYNNLKDKKFEQKFESIIKDIETKKGKDLSIIHKIEESISHRYDYIIDYYRSLQKSLRNLTINSKDKYLGLKDYSKNEDFKSDILLNSIIEIKNKMNIINHKIEPFFDLNNHNQKSFSNSYRINDLKKILKMEKKDELKSPILSLFFIDFSIIIYPYGKSGNSSYIELGVLFNSKIKHKYNFDIIIEIGSKNKLINPLKNIKNISNNQLYIFANFCKREDLEKNGYLDDNGDLIINYTFNFNEKNVFLYDIEEYYKIYINKSLELKGIELNSNDWLISPKKNIEKKNEKSKSTLLGIKTKSNSKNPKIILDDDDEEDE